MPTLLNAVATFSELSECSVDSVLSADSVSSVDSEFSEEFCCSRNLREGQSGRRAFGRFKAFFFRPFRG